MRRFEIQDIVYQTEDGITYLATDRDMGGNVALRRFFPFGRDNGGLDSATTEIYLELCERLATATHPALRTVIRGFVDPIDSIPCMATEWIDGKPLPIILDGERLETDQILQVVRKAIEVSIVLSEAIGEEAVWIDTTERSVVLDSSSQERKYTFWVCPFRCLGIYPLSKGIDSIAGLAEELAGWKSKIYSDQARNGLGAWIKSMKRAPSTPLKEALDALPSTAAATTTDATDAVAVPESSPEPAPITVSPRPGSAAQAAPAPTPQPIAVSPRPGAAAQPAPAPRLQATSTPLAIGTQQLQSTSGQATTQLGQQPLLKSAESGTSWVKITLWGSAAALIIGLVGIQLRPSANEPDLLANNSSEMELPGMDLMDMQEQSSPTIVEKHAIESERATAMPALAANAAPTAELKSPQTDSGIVQMRGRVPAMATQQVKEGKPPVFTPTESAKIDNIKTLTQVQLRGVLKRARLSSSGKSLYLDFSNPYQSGQIRGVVYPGSFKEYYGPKTFAPFIGKEIIISGSYKKETSKNPWLIQFKSLQQISIAPTTSTAAAPTFKPNQIKEIERLEDRTLAKVRGFVKSVSQGNAGERFFINFSNNAEAKKIRGCIYRPNFQDEFHSKSFEKLVGKEIIIDGFYRELPTEGLWLIRFDSMKQIKIVK